MAEGGEVEKQLGALRMLSMQGPQYVQKGAGTYSHGGRSGKGMAEGGDPGATYDDTLSVIINSLMAQPRKMAGGGSASKWLQGYRGTSVAPGRSGFRVDLSSRPMTMVDPQSSEQPVAEAQRYLMGLPGPVRKALMNDYLRDMTGGAGEFNSILEGGRSPQRYGEMLDLMRRPGVDKKWGVEIPPYTGPVKEYRRGGVAREDNPRMTFKDWWMGDALKRGGMPRRYAGGGYSSAPTNYTPVSDEDSAAALTYIRNQRKRENMKHIYKWDAPTAFGGELAPPPQSFAHLTPEERESYRRAVTGDREAGPLENTFDAALWGSMALPVTGIAGGLGRAANWLWNTRKGLGAQGGAYSGEASGEDDDMVIKRAIERARMLNSSRARSREG